LRQIQLLGHVVDQAVRLLASVLIVADPRAIFRKTEFVAVTDSLTNHVIMESRASCRVIYVRQSVSLFLVLEELFKLIAIFALFDDVVSKVDAVGTALYPGGFRHWCVDLLEVELSLYTLFVHIGDHVRRLNERH